MLALEHSSLRWNGASYPLMVQMTPRNDISTAMPGGQAVPLVIVPQTTLELFVFGLLMFAVGITIKKTSKDRRLIMVPAWLNRARKRVWKEAMNA